MVHLQNSAHDKDRGDDSAKGCVLWIRPWGNKPPPVRARAVKRNETEITEQKKEEKMIFIRKSGGWYAINDNFGHHMRYLYHTKREALRDFKEKFGYRYMRGICVVDYT